jgi:hypothetical protein
LNNYTTKYEREILFMSIDTGQEIPKEMDIFYSSLSSFIPTGKTWSDLTPQEQEEIKNKYRFSPMKPGIYQGITGIGTDPC